MEAMIYQAINGVMQDVGAIGKEKYNKQQGFKFRGIDDVMNALYPAMIKNRVFAVPEVLEMTREERQTKSGGNLMFSICKMRYTFYAEDGSSVQAVVIGEGMDSGDKATNKAMAIAFKYACFQTFCIPTEEMSDPDAETPEPSSKKKKSSSKSEGSGRLPDEQEAADSLIDTAKINTIIGKLKSKGVSEATILKTYKLHSIKEMTVSQWMNAMKRLDLTPDKEGQQ